MMTHLKLPLHVVAKPPRKDGTRSVLFRVRKQRPEGWPSSIPLPINPPRRGDFNDPSEVARIFADAAILTKRLEERRAGAAVTHAPGTMPAVAAQWEASWGDTLRERTKHFYRGELRILLAWSEAGKDQPLAKLTLPQILKFLNKYRDRPAQQAALRRTLSALLSYAREQGVIQTHPLGAPVRVKKQRKRRKRPVELWDAKIVQSYADKADALGWRGFANLLFLMWETSADATDVVTWRNGANLPADRDVIEYTRGKTGESACVPISAKLAARLRKFGVMLVLDPNGRPYKAECVKSDNRRSKDFDKLRKAVVADGGERRILDHLRHSAITDALTKGAKLEHMPSLSAHRGEQMVETVYSQLTAEQARMVQQARGIIE